ncbi:HIT family protein [Portibacter marinus]|uniref:HIT family protein n=1 Tax=Portibacter marinus TaxID=2898660 RepID=UPI001F28EBB4|nr:HIT family protein [Portibacter marinus]
MRLFTKIAAGEIPSYKVAENDEYSAFLDINPLVKGHTLVIPRREEDYIFDLADQELSGLMVFAKKVARAIEQVVDCERIGISVIGLEVPHAHVHLIPIDHVSDMNFGKARVQLSESEFADLAQKIASKVE